MYSVHTLTPLYNIHLDIVTGVHQLMRYSVSLSLTLYYVDTHNKHWHWHPHSILVTDIHYKITNVHHFVLFIYCIIFLNEVCLIHERDSLIRRQQDRLGGQMTNTYLHKLGGCRRFNKYIVQTLIGSRKHQQVHTKGL